VIRYARLPASAGHPHVRLGDSAVSNSQGQTGLPFGVNQSDTGNPVCFVPISIRAMPPDSLGSFAAPVRTSRPTIRRSVDRQWRSRHTRSSPDTARRDPGRACRNLLRDRQRTCRSARRDISLGPSRAVALRPRRVARSNWAPSRKWWCRQWPTLRAGGSLDGRDRQRQAHKSNSHARENEPAVQTLCPLSTGIR